MIYVALVFSSLFIFTEGRDLYRQRQWRELSVAGVFLLLGLFYSLDIILKLNYLPNPSAFYVWLEPAGHALRSFLPNHY